MSFGVGDSDDARGGRAIDGSYDGGGRPGPWSVDGDRDVGRFPRRTDPTSPAGSNRIGESHRHPTPQGLSGLGPGDHPIEGGIGLGGLMGGQGGGETGERTVRHEGPLRSRVLLGDGRGDRGRNGAAQSVLERDTGKGRRSFRIVGDQHVEAFERRDGDGATVLAEAATITVNAEGDQVRFRGEDSPGAGSDLPDRIEGNSHPSAGSQVPGATGTSDGPARRMAIRPRTTIKAAPSKRVIRIRTRRV